MNFGDGYSRTIYSNPPSYITWPFWSRRRKIYYLSGYRAGAKKIASRSGRLRTKCVLVCRPCARERARPRSRVRGRCARRKGNGKRERGRNADRWKFGTTFHCSCGTSNDDNDHVECFSRSLKFRKIAFVSSVSAGSALYAISPMRKCILRIKFLFRSAPLVKQICRKTFAKKKKKKIRHEFHTTTGSLNVSFNHIVMRACVSVANFVIKISFIANCGRKTGPQGLKEKGQK